jgi:hypothetical protein
MGRALLLGNGVNRLSSETAWVDVLRDLADHVGAADVLEWAQWKPFALLYEEIAFRSGARSRRQESALKRRVADLVGRLKVNDYHRRLVEAVDTHVLTTNYDCNLEKACGSVGEPASLEPESRYSVFRRRQIGDRFVWHIHGEVAQPDSILLGHDHYCGQLQKLRAYATADRRPRRTAKSPFKIGQLNYEESGAVYSWIDVFFRDEVHILGLALDYTEVDLWWLLAYKRRLQQMSQYHVGRTIFHEILNREVDARERARVSILKSFGVDVVTHYICGSYAEAYDRVIEGLTATREGPGEPWVQ